MLSRALAFYGVQLLCPVFACFFSYLIAYLRRLRGTPGRDLEAGLALHGAGLAAALSFFFFWGWPASAGPFYDQPGLSWVRAVLGSPPEQDPNLTTLKLIFATLFATAMGTVARVMAGPLNRRLVRKVPRFFAAFGGFRRR